MSGAELETAATGEDPNEKPSRGARRCAAACRAVRSSCPGRQQGRRQGRRVAAAHGQHGVGREDQSHRSRDRGRGSERAGSRGWLQARTRGWRQPMRAAGSARSGRATDQPGKGAAVDRGMVLQRLGRGRAGRQRREGAATGQYLHRGPDRGRLRTLCLPELHAEPLFARAGSEAAAEGFQVRNRSQSSSRTTTLA